MKNKIKCSKQLLYRCKVYTISFLFFLLFTIVTHLSFGDTSGRGFSFADNTPYTWNDIWVKFPNILLETILISAFVGTIFVQVKKKQKQDIEAARKRIAEREKDGENSKTRVDDIVKEVMKNSKQAESKGEKE